jgi:hypothetical protein
VKRGGGVRDRTRVDGFTVTESTPSREPRNRAARDIAPRVTRFQADAKKLPDTSVLFLRGPPWNSRIICHSTA